MKASKWKGKNRVEEEVLKEDEQQKCAKNLLNSPQMLLNTFQHPETVGLLYK